MANFWERAQPLAAAAAQISRLRGETNEASLLEKARASLLETGYDNWNGGTTLFTLMLEVPIPIYAAVEDDREALEKSIKDRISQIVRGELGNAITEVVIGPALPDAARPFEPSSSDAVIYEEVPTFWQPGFFRLFVTHLAVHKGSAHRLKEALGAFQVACFVAHDDIEPTKEWQLEIERALRTMDGLAAIVTPGLIESRWCDQEIGIAIGRGKLVIPLCAGADPHGFLGKYQGVQVKGLEPSFIAERVFDVLMRNPLSNQRMSDALVERLVASEAWDVSKRAISLLEKSASLNSAQIARLFGAVEENPKVKNAFGVPERIRKLAERVQTAA